MLGIWGGAASELAGVRPDVELEDRTVMAGGLKRAAAEVWNSVNTCTAPCYLGAPLRWKGDDSRMSGAGQVAARQRPWLRPSSVVAEAHGLYAGIANLRRLGMNKLARHG